MAQEERTRSARAIQYKKQMTIWPFMPRKDDRWRRERGWDGMMTLKEKDIRISLLDYLSGEAGCHYLSDLHDPAYRKRLCRMIDEIPAERFLLKVWLDAAAYLGMPEAVWGCRTAEEAKTCLRQACERG